MKQPIALIIMDGFGLNPDDYGNAIKAAHPKNICSYMASCPWVKVDASGMAVGLPKGQMGNSEVGHTNIGAGRIVYQELTRISKSIEDGDFFQNPELLGAVNNCVRMDSDLHIMGLLSDGGVHSHNTHIYALLELAKRQGLKNVYVHAMLDGRDVPPTSGAGYIRELEAKMKEIGVGRVATVTGRYYAMDRDNRWERVEKGYLAMVTGEAPRSESPAQAVEQSYAEGVTDEFVVPFTCMEEGRIKPYDSVIFANFRPDRAREITRALVDKDFDGFKRANGCFPLSFVCMTQYDASMPGVSVAFKPEELRSTFGEYISRLGLKQLRIAETEKYAHVTFFFNGGREKQYDGEDRALIPSPKVATYDLKPEMSAYEVAREAVDRVKSGVYDVIVLNFANCDMVGHTGVFDAAVRAVHAVDACVGMVTDAVEEQGGISIITADHGNADKMYEPDGSPFTAHTTNFVPFIVRGADCKLREGGVLADIAPTMLKLMGLEQPAEMTGKSIII